ncbi:MAG TPA: MFS transporter [Bacillota bacterium]|nr:MFS transporter [Bacillota bacterium]
MPNQTPNLNSRKNKNILLLAAIVGVSFSLRAPITSIGPMAGLIHDDLNVSNGFIGFITTLPLIAFAVSSPFISKFSGKLGLGRTMLAGLAVLTAGGILRAYTGIAGLLIGTALVGVGISVANVLMPSIVKLKFPDRIGIVTGIYLTSVAVVASIGAGISYPLAMSGLGWKATSMVWAMVALLALFIWFPQRGIDSHEEAQLACAETDKKCDAFASARDASGRIGGKAKNIWKSPLAWCITIYFGLQSFNYYSLTAWIPSILQSNGTSPVMAGYLALWFQLVGIPSSFLTPILAGRVKNQFSIVAGACVAYFLGFGILALFHSVPATFIALAFLANGGCASFAWSMAMFSLKAANAEESVKLSGMTQSIGYLLSAIGPTLCGVIFDAVGTWTIVFILYFIITAVMIAAGILASKREKLFS